MAKAKPFSLHLKRNLLTGFFTIIPLWITWLVFNFLVEQLSSLGEPWARGISKAVEKHTPVVAQWFYEPWFQSTLAVITTLILLYLLGWLANVVLGRKILNLFDEIMQRIPFVQSVYGSVKKLLGVLAQKPEGMDRVVLIEFPSPELKTVGIVTRIFEDANTGEELAAVYVPTTPNPTSGYLEIVPVKRLVSTNWTMDEAMTFIISGGAVAPEKVSLTSSLAKEEK